MVVINKGRALGYWPYSRTTYLELPVFQNEAVCSLQCRKAAVTSAAAYKQILKNSCASEVKFKGNYTASRNSISILDYYIHDVRGTLCRWYSQVIRLVTL
jgi:hypothetical protein